jgi:branched-chain amino acid aminotransferase
MYVQVSQFARAEGWEECILTNHYGQVCESMYSNIFLVKGDKLYTPELDSGCANGVMRSYLLGLMEDKVVEKEIDVEELFNADEILLTNAVKGVQWVKELRGKTFTNKKAEELTALLNENLLG